MPAPIQTNREKEIFEQALDLPTTERREAYLEAACGVDATLLQRVNDLLRVHTQATGFLPDEPAVAGPRNALAAVAEMLTADQTTGAVSITDQPGDHIGHYKLLEKLGEGGFGVVYMAEQREPVKRRVALKIIKLGMDTREVVARFEAERQALALMDHPNIAKIFDGGVTGSPHPQPLSHLMGEGGQSADAVSPSPGGEGRGEGGSNPPIANQKSQIPHGRPYFVMELVRGIRITDYCDQNQLGLEERLKLFMQICHAVQHAHQKGIIHRDLKPSNILVTLHDGVPVPKVIDFGIAKAMQQELTEKTLFTQFHQFIGTPSYMSPEQAELSGLDIDTRSDIYSLGVLLYELLAGKPPFDGQALLQAGLDEMRRTLREVEPPRPSTRLKQTRSSQPDAATQSAISARKSQIDPDLDWIVMKCLEKDRARRYETANGLAADLQRHLSDEPVTARPPSALYRFQKAVRRNKVAVTAVSAIAFSLVLGLGLAMWQAVLAHAAQREQTRLRLQAEASERTAKSEALRNERVSRFFRNMLKGVGPSVALGRDTTLMREILDKSAKELSADLKDESSVEAQMRNTIGEVYQQLGDWPRAEAMAREALVLRPRLNGGEHKEVANSLELLGKIHSKRKEHAQAEAAHLEALTLRRRLFGTWSEAVSLSLNNLGIALERRGDLADAEARYREAMEIDRRINGEAGPNPLFNLAGIHIKRGEYAEAEKLLRRYLEIVGTRMGDDSPTVANMFEQLALAFSKQGKLDEAERLNREALAIYRKVKGENHPDLARSLQNLAFVLKKLGQFAESQSLMLTSLAIQERLYGHESRQVATTLFNLGTIVSDAGDHVQAERYERECLAIRKKLYGPDHPDVASALSNLGWALAKQKLWPEAERTLQAALDMLDRSPFARPKDRRLPLGNLFSVLSRQGKFAELELLLDKALRAVTDPGLKVVYLETRGNLHARRCRWPEAVADFARAVELESDNDELYHELAPLLVQSGDLEAYRKHCHNEVARFRGTKDSKIAGKMASDCLLLSNSGADLKVVAAWAELAVTVGQNSRDLPWFQYARGLAEYRQGHFAEAIEWAQKALRPGDEYRDPQATAVLAMAQQQAGQPDAARASLARAVELIGKLPKLESGDIGDNWMRWIIAQTLLREVRNLIEGQPASIATPKLSDPEEANP